MTGEAVAGRSTESMDDPERGVDETGTIDWFLIEAPHRTLTGALVGPLLELVDRRLIRILDVLVLVTRGDADYEVLTTSDLDEEVVGDLGSLSGASSGLLSAEDAAQAAALLSREAGGQLLARGNLPTQAVIAALDALDA